MYDKFGNFDSVEELNARAEEIRKEGSLDKLKELAEENGIPQIFAEQYASGGSVEFTDWMNAAIGKIDIEAAGHKDKYVPVQPVADYLKSLCMEEPFARYVRRRTKSMEGCMGYVEKETGFLVRKGIRHVPDLHVFHWARDYFLEGGTRE